MPIFRIFTLFKLYLFFWYFTTNIILSNELVSEIDDGSSVLAFLGQDNSVPSKINQEPTPSPTPDSFYNYLHKIFKEGFTLVSTALTYNDKKPKCFISRAWEEDINHSHHFFARKLKGDLEKYGIKSIIDENDLNVGDSIPDFIKKISDDDFLVIAIFTKRYKKRFKNKKSWICKEVDLIEKRLKQDNSFYIPLLLKDNPQDSDKNSIPDILDPINILHLKYEKNLDYPNFSYNNYEVNLKNILNKISIYKKKSKPAFFLNQGRYFYPIFIGSIFFMYYCNNYYSGDSFQIKFTDQIKKYIFSINSDNQHNFSIETSLDNLPNQKGLRKWEKAKSTNLSYLPLHSLPDFDSIGFSETFPIGKNESYLTQLWKGLNENQSYIVSDRGGVPRYAISGMPGIGKTQHALAYAYEARLNSAYNVIYWIYSENVENIYQSYKNLLHDFEVDTTKIKREKLKHSVEKVLFDNSLKWLLIYDNLPAARDLKGIIPQQGGHVLITSRDQEGWDRKQVDLTPFQPKEAVNFLLQKMGLVGIATEEQKNMALAIADEVGYLQLALSYAASYMERKHINFKDYFEEIKKEATQFFLYHPDKELQNMTNELSLCRNESERKELVKKIRIYAQEINDYPFSIGLTWHLLYQELNHHQKKLFSYLCYYDADNILVDTLKFITIKENESLLHNNELLMSSIYELNQYSLISYNKEKNLISLHRLVQRTMQGNTHEIIEIIEDSTLAWLIYLESQECSLKEKSQNELYEIYQDISFILPHKNKLREHLGSLKQKSNLDLEPTINRLIFSLNIIEKQVKIMLRKLAYMMERSPYTNDEVLIPDFKETFKEQENQEDLYFQDLLNQQKNLIKTAKNQSTTEVLLESFDTLNKKYKTIYKISVIEENIHLLQEESFAEKMADTWDMPNLRRVKSSFMKIKNNYNLDLSIKSDMVKTNKWKSALAKMERLNTDWLNQFRYYDQIFLIQNLFNLEEITCDETLEKAKILITENMDAFDQAFIIAEASRYPRQVWNESIQKIKTLTALLNNKHIKIFDFLCLIDLASTIDITLWNNLIKHLSPMLNHFKDISDFVRYIESTQYIENTNLIENHNSDYALGELIEWYLKAANGGSLKAQLILGQIYGKTEMIKNQTEAMKWNHLAAEQGEAVAQHNLGYGYLVGQGVEKNLVTAFKWIKRAADQKLPRSECLLGNLYAFGEGVKRNFVEAVKWYRRAAEQDVAFAQYHMGNRYYFGEGVDRDFVEAVKWYRRAAEQGFIHAQYNLGNAYSKGEGIEKDFVKAVKWYKLAAKQGHDRAQFNLGNRYYSGEGVERNFDKAMKWHTLSAEQGFVMAQYALGMAYLTGDNVIQNPTEAVVWFKKAANQQYAAASHMLEICHSQGLGVNKNFIEAAYWSALAKEQDSLKFESGSPLYKN